MDWINPSQLINIKDLPFSYLMCGRSVALGGVANPVMLTLRPS